jgi:hypothetical protein
LVEDNNRTCLEQQYNMDSSWNACHWPKNTRRQIKKNEHYIW